MVSLNKKEHISYTYEVTDFFGRRGVFDNKKEAEYHLGIATMEENIINKYVKPHGVTLVVCNNSGIYYKTYPAFIGYNGVPFCDANRAKNREFFWNGINSVQDHMSSIHGNVCEVLKKAYDLLHNVGCFDRIDGAYHYYWNPAVGNPCCFPVGDYWLEETVLWYNWDGEHFTTNDPDCELSDNSFK